MGTSDIEAAINSIPKMKDDLRKAFEFFQSYSASVSSFTVQWKDLEDHYSSIEKSIEERFRELKEFDSSLAAKHPGAALRTLKTDKKLSKPAEVQTHPELKALCCKMDGEGLISFITDNKKDLVEIQTELVSALLSAPDPVNLVLDSLVCFVPSEETADGKLQSIRRTCASILGSLGGLELDITTEARDRARKLAMEWKRMITDGKGDNSIVVLSFLRLVITFGLAESFEDDDILDLIIPLVKRKYVIDLCRNPAFEGKMPTLVEKLKDSGKQLDAVKFVLAFNLEAKYPPASLLQSYIKDSKQLANELRSQGNNSMQSKNAAFAIEIDRLKAVIRTVGEYNLKSIFPCGTHQKRIEQLERQKLENKSEKKRGSASISAFGKGQSKRPRPSDSYAPVYSAPPPARNPPPLGPVDRAPYMGSYSAAPSLYVHGNSSLPGDYVPHAPSNSYMYPSEPPSGSGYYDRAVVNGGYKPPGLPAYNPSMYP